MILRRSLLAAGLLGTASAAYGFGFSPFAEPVITRHVLSPPGWPAGLRLRIAVLADLHAGAPLMSRDNLASMQTPNVASGACPGLSALGVLHAAHISSVFPARTPHAR
jgi:hypothetical protein